MMTVFHRTKYFLCVLIIRRLLRTAAVISDTHCFVDIFGLGVAGRLLAPGGPTSRLLLVEAYSVWDSTTYSITIHIPHLKVRWQTQPISHILTCVYYQSACSSEKNIFSSPEGSESC
jgi:hypothetical protein